LLPITTRLFKTGKVRARHKIFFKGTKCPLGFQEGKVKSGLKKRSETVQRLLLYKG
jgi:hypothetical protein